MAAKANQTTKTAADKQAAKDAAKEAATLDAPDPELAKAAAEQDAAKSKAAKPDEGEVTLESLNGALNALVGRIETLEAKVGDLVDENTRTLERMRKLRTGGGVKADSNTQHGSIDDLAAMK